MSRRALEFRPHAASDGTPYRVCEIGGGSVRFWFDGHRSNLGLYVRVGETMNSVSIHASAETDDDAIAEAENRLREVSPLAWETYARVVLVGADPANDLDAATSTTEHVAEVAL